MAKDEKDQTIEGIETTEAEINSEASAETIAETEETPPVNVGATEQPKEETPEAKIARLQNESADNKDKWLRAVAELDNFRKRMTKEQQQAIRVHTDNIFLDVLEVIDNLERALSAAKESSPESFTKGVELIYQQFIGPLEKRGVKEIEVKGKPFDPLLHEALMHVESDQPTDTVIDVIQKGYKIHDRILRHARVTVAKEK